MKRWFCDICGADVTYEAQAINLWKSKPTVKATIHKPQTLNENGMTPPKEYCWSCVLKGLTSAIGGTNA